MGMAKSKPRKNQAASMSDLTHDLLVLIMMKVGVGDFVSFSRVCKSWRLLALSNKNKFLVSRPPMSIWIRSHAFRKDCCCLEDSDGRLFETTLIRATGRTLVGCTCGYLILYGKETHDFWLVNPITRHELHFPSFSYSLDDTPERVMAILVYSASMSGWVFVMGKRCSTDIWFSIAGKGAWNQLTSSYFTFDLHAFKGKIYTITTRFWKWKICELILYPNPKLTLLETKNVPDLQCFGWEIVSLGESLYVIGLNMLNKYTVVELDTSETQWVQPKNTMAYEYNYLVSVLKHASYAAKQSERKALYDLYTYLQLHDDKRRKDKFFKMLYYTHNCMNVDIIH